MSDSEYLVFDNEPVDAGSPITATYGSVWATWLLGVAKQLTNPDVWHPESQVELAVQYANELVTRLMGRDVLSGQIMPYLPIVLNPMYFLQVVPESISWYQGNAATFYRTFVYSTEDNIEREWCYFDVFLAAGTWRFRFMVAEGPTRGKMLIHCDDDIGFSTAPHDCYAAVTDYEAYFVDQVTVIVPKVYTVKIAKRYKNAASSTAGITLFAITVERIP